jgi:DNA processing protein
LEAAQGLAIVGSRHPSAYGRRVARDFALAAARALPVVSGLARGIDSVAHRAALEVGGLTCAVLGGGLDRIYPPENAGLAAEILEKGGCLLSEYPPGAPSLPHHFLVRDRIIAGLGWATVVVEGAKRSGTLATARHAGEAGREVFAIPGAVDNPMSHAPNHLIREGATLARSMDDVWKALPPGCQPAVPYSKTSPSPPRLPTEQAAILKQLGSESLTIEEMISRTGLAFSRLSNILLDMELNEVIEALPGQRYAKKG